LRKLLQAPVEQVEAAVVTVGALLTSACGLVITPNHSKISFARFDSSRLRECAQRNRDP
jgi:hypothetical protein